MDISLSQLPRYVGSGPMIVYEPETVGIPRQRPAAKKPDKAKEKQRVVAAIRAATEPAVAKRTIDASIAKAAATNQTRAETIMRAVGVDFTPRSVTMSGIFDWLTGSGKLSDLSKYTGAEQVQLKTFLKAETNSVIEKTFNQAELDQILAKIQSGVKLPANLPPLVDPYSAATKEYKVLVTQALGPLGAVAIKTGTSAADIVGTSIVASYRENTDAPGRSFEWLSNAKWVIGIGALIAGGFFAWPYVKPYVGNSSVVGQ